MRYFPVLLAGGMAVVLPSCSDPDTASESTSNPDPAAWFAEEARQRGIDFVHVSGHAGRHYIPEIMAGGAALFDMDGDGDLDLYLVQGGSVPGDPSGNPPNRLYENSGAGVFSDITEKSGAGDRGYGIGVAAGDVDNDGDVDLYVTNLRRNSLLLNDGSGHFQDGTLDAGLESDAYSSSASFFDYDRDGDLDLYVCNYLYWSPENEIDCKNTLEQDDYCAPATYASPARDQLYRNDGDGVFSDVSVASGIAMLPGTGLGVSAFDANMDGWLDAFIANDGMPDRLWMNRGDGTFVDEAMRAGCAMDNSGKAKAGMGVATGDLDHDGDADLLVCNLWRETDSLYLNSGGGTFTDATIRSGLAATPKTFTRFGLGFRDFDNDGQLDLYQANGRVARLSNLHGPDPYDEPNLLFRGSGSLRFQEVEPRGGTEELLASTSRAAAFGDIDNDGGVDIVVVNRDAAPYLLRNVYPSPGHWLTVSVLDKHGRDAYGAVLTARAGERTWTTIVGADGSYCASSDPRVHIGLGAVDSIDAISVRWPDGQEQALGPREVDSIIVIQQGQ